MKRFATVAAATGLVAATSCAAEFSLIDFDQYDPAKIIPIEYSAPYWVTPAVVKSAKIHVERRKLATGTVLDVTVADPFLDNPGIALLPPDGRKYWDLSGFEELHADVENLDDNQQMMLSVRVNNPRVNAVETANNSGFALNPRERGILKLYYPQADELSQVRIPWMHAVPRGVPGPKNVDGHRIEAISFYGHDLKTHTRNGAYRYRIHSIRLVRPKRPDPAAVRSPETFFPFVDRYGQYMHETWTEKILSDSDFAGKKKQEEASRRGRIASWNRFGGWANGPKVEAKGYFYPVKFEGKWYLADPEGCLFFSHGINTLRFDIWAEQKADNWFLPENRTPRRNYNFARDNLVKKFGKNFRKEYPSFACTRLEEWGLNTIGNWADLPFMKLGKTPYAMEIPGPKCPSTASVPGLEKGIFDVFSPEFTSSMRTAAQSPKFAFAQKDPMLIGIFINNEIRWGDRTAAARSAFASSAEQPAKKEFVQFLKTKFIAVELLNRKWSEHYPDWNAVAKSTVLPDLEKAREELIDFNRHIFETYYSTCRRIVKEFAPNTIYFGSRLHVTGMPELYAAASKYADVVATNTYTWSFDGLRKEGLPDDKPILISEFHVAVLDRGLLNADLRPSGVTQTDRAQAYLRLMQGALLHKQIVGAHFFCYRDEPVTGRWDGENFAVGLVDVADTPYWELVSAMRKVGENMMEYRRKGSFQCNLL
ncbi:MAG: hypothetical protein PHS41_12050 [Victivallaceae bacterium]|nr:hypothetical protein [Victivallaceae bacterium]